ncbi:hypothetical protein BT69DRAFT_1321953 [Atractiella rhizophila]|nr:hypothetical protein BT69DRAFT_1321953 [Atractiella rhizophila]
MLPPPLHTPLRLLHLHPRELNLRAVLLCGQAFRWTRSPASVTVHNNEAEGPSGDVAEGRLERGREGEAEEWSLAWEDRTVVLRQIVVHRANSEVARNRERNSLPLTVPPGSRFPYCLVPRLPEGYDASTARRILSGHSQKRQSYLSINLTALRRFWERVDGGYRIELNGEIHFFPTDIVLALLAGLLVLFLGGKKGGKGKYTMSKGIYDKIQVAFRERWGEWSGWAQQILFTSDLKGFEGFDWSETLAAKQVEVLKVEEEEVEGKTRVMKRQREVEFENNVKSEMRMTRKKIRVDEKSTTVTAEQGGAKLEDADEGWGGFGDPYPTPLSLVMEKTIDLVQNDDCILAESVKGRKGRTRMRFG